MTKGYDGFPLSRNSNASAYKRKICGVNTVVSLYQRTSVNVTIELSLNFSVYARPSDTSPLFYLSAHARLHGSGKPPLKSEFDHGNKRRALGHEFIQQKSLAWILICTLCGLHWKKRRFLEERKRRQLKQQGDKKHSSF